MIEFVGGTGPDGMGLALSFAMAGNPVLIGSRNARRARDAADSVTADSGGSSCPVACRAASRATSGSAALTRPETEGLERRAVRSGFDGLAVPEGQVAVQPGEAAAESGWGTSR